MNDATQKERVKERWLTVVGYADYEVSDCGRVRRRRLAFYHNSHGVLAQTYSSGYAYVSLSIRSRTVRATIHRLVAEAFIGPRPAGMHVDHIDRNRLNNRVANLRYLSASDNARHSARRGEASAVARHREVDVREWKRLMSDGVSIYALSRRFGVSYTTLGDIKRGRTWAHV